MSLGDDPVISERDVYVSTLLGPYLNVFQLPGQTEELEGDMCSCNMRFRRNHKLIEMDLPLDTRHPSYCRERGEELAASSLSGRVREAGFAAVTPTADGGDVMNTLKLAGSVRTLNRDRSSRHFVALCRPDSIHLTPVENIYALRPKLDYLDESDIKTKSTIKRLDSADAVSTNAAAPPKAVPVQFKKRETEEQIAARLSSYSYLQRQVDDEAWVHLTHFLPKSNESAAVADRLLCTNLGPLPFKE